MHERPDLATGQPALISNETRVHTDKQAASHLWGPSPPGGK